MRKCYLILIYLFAFGSLFNSCKYKENDRLSFDAVKHKLSKAPWHLKRLLINGEDITIQHIQKFNPVFDSPERFVLTIKKFSGNSTTANLTLPDGTAFQTLTIGFEHNQRKKITIPGPIKGTYTYPPYVFIFYVDGTYEWEIRKLTNKEFFVEVTDSNNDRVRVELIR